ncbi:AEC family transporter [Minwuia sp.]|uniref:AEC family transporter n=1 Tax=Minwuia sp. TaxID=2493630 RepID=UPI003A9325A3
MTAELFAIIAPVFLIAGIGLAWGRLKLPFDTATVTGIATRVGTPALILATLSRLEVTAEAFTEMLLATVLTLGGFALVGLAVLLVCRMSPRAFLTPVMMANAGNMGLPLCLFAFGQEGLSLGIACFAVIAGYHFTFGIALVSGRWSFAAILKTPVVWASVIGIGLLLAGTPLPGWLHNTLQVLGGIAIPLMLIALGVSLASLEVRSLKDGTIVALIRLVAGLAVGLGVAELLGLEGAARGVIIIQSAMPVAVFNYLFAATYDQRPGAVAGSVLISTAISFLTLPFLLLLALERF